MRKFVGFVGIFGILLGMVKIAEARDIYVPGNYATIQAAISAAITGDTIRVANGTYTGTGNKNLTWSGKKITVRSENGSNNCIIDCGGSGRGFYLNNAYDCGTISGFTIRNGSASTGGGIYCDYSSLTITNCTISGNNAAGYGGGIYCDYSFFPTITNCTISGNNATYGGGIYCYSCSSLTITNNIISNNSGYGIYEENTTSDPPTNYNCFYNNTPYNYRNEGTTNVNDVNTIVGNRNNIFADPQFIGGSDFHIGTYSPCIDTGSNTARAIPATDKDGNPRIYNNHIVDMGVYEFQGTSTSPPPSGIITKQAEESEVYPSHFATYTVTYYAAGTTSLEIQDIFNPGSMSYYMATPTPTSIIPSGSITWTISPYQPYTFGIITVIMQIATATTPYTYIANEAKLYAGSQILLATDTETVYVGTPTVKPGSVTVYDADNNFIRNYATIQAGINACPDGGTVLVTDGTWTGTLNKDLTWSRKKITIRSVNGPNNCIIDCENSGRGFYFDGAGNCGTISGFTIRNGYVTGTWSTNCGGGIYCNSYSSPTITNCTISGNNAAGYGGGGGICCYDHSSPTITNCTISGNNATGWGGGIYCSYYSFPTITNCTISGNNATQHGGGIYCYSYSSPTITNNIILSNSGYGIYEYDTTSDPSIKYNCLDNNTPSNYRNEGTTDVNDVNTIVGNRNNIFADPQFIGVNDFHLGTYSSCINAGSNTARVIPSTDKDGNHRPYNGGIADMGAYEFQGTPPTFTSVLPTQGTVGTIVTVMGNGFGASESVMIQFGNTPTITMSTTTGSGEFQVVFTVNSQLMGTTTIVARGLHTNTYAKAYFVILRSMSTDIYVPGNYTTIQAAINAATTGDTVWVANGTWTGTGNKNLTWSGKKITVRSENGLNNCIIDCQNSGRGFYLNNAGNCGTISGFTIRNGSAEYGGGIYCGSSSPTITNCTISGNSTSNCGGGIYSSSSSPTITNCTISGNNANSKGGGIYCSSFSSPTITNCTISGNNATQYGGGIYSFSSASPIITNNIISNNSGYGIYEYDATSDSPTNYNCLDNNTPYNYCDEGTMGLNDVNTIVGNSNNIFADPQFIGGSDYHLQPTSPCIDTGSNIARAIPERDKDGNPRIINFTVDMGAYEFQGTSTTHGQATSLKITSANITLTADQQQAYRGTATDLDGNQWDVTNEISFGENDPVGTMTGNIYYAGKVGTWTITGTYLTLIATTAVTVTYGSPTTINVLSPATTTTSATFTMIITLLDIDGNIYEGTAAATILNTTNSIAPSTITLAGATTAICKITKAPNGGTDTITISYGAIKTFSQVMVFLDSKTGGTVTSNEVTIVIGTLTANTVVCIATSTQEPANLPANIFFGGIAYNIEIKDEQGNQTGTQAGQIGTVAIYFSYNDAYNDGIVDGTSIKEENLRIYHFDNGTWTPLATTVMVAENIAWAYIPHFSAFILAGPVFSSPDLIKVFAYPNPCRIHKGNEQITFKGLTTQANIKIFNIVGELIKEIEHTNGTDEEVWTDPCNVASGIYIYLITNDKGEKAIGKLGIIK